MKQLKEIFENNTRDIAIFQEALTNHIFSNIMQRKNTIDFFEYIGKIKTDIKKTYKDKGVFAGSVNTGNSDLTEALDIVCGDKSAQHGWACLCDKSISKIQTALLECVSDAISLFQSEISIDY